MDELPSSAGSLDFSPWTIRAMTHQTSRFPPFAPYHTLPSNGELRHSPRSFTRKGLSPCFTLGKPWFLELFHVGTSTAWDGYGWWFRNPVPLEMYKTLVNKGGFFICLTHNQAPVWPAPIHPDQRPQWPFSIPRVTLTNAPIDPFQYPLHWDEHRVMKS